MKKNHILCIETSGRQSSVCIIQDLKVVSFESSKTEQSAASTLNGMITDVLSSANITLQDLKAVALSGGPGSYTGLRIGASTAKGICFALNLPLLHISTLQIMAASAIKNSSDHKYKQVLTAIDARNGNYYVGLYDTSKVEMQEIRFLNIQDANLQKHLNDPKTLLACNTLLSSGQNFQIENQKISAKDMADLASEKYANAEFEDLTYYEPTYLTGFFK